MLLGMLGGFGFGVLWAHAERRAALIPRYASALAGTTLAALPVATVVLFTASASSLPLAAAIVVVTTAAWVSRHLARATLVGVDRHWAQALHAAAPLGAVHPPFVLTSVVLLEIGMRLPGLGSAAVDAIGNDDVDVWMACSLSLALVTLVLRNLADLILARGTATDSEP
jgi:ABC-type dipeptide/oligopeptide/nickel transport system permease component